MLNKWLIVIFAGTLWAPSTLAGKSPPERPGSRPGKTCDAAPDATRAAVELLRSYVYARKYDEKSARVENDGDAWIVRFRKVVNEMPAEGWIRVYKPNCASEWIPLK